MMFRPKLDALLKKFEREYDPYNRLEISGQALRHNYRLMQGITGLAVFPVLKGNAYGHGIELVSQALRSETFPYIAVDGYFEALRVRSASRQPVLVMGAIKPGNFAGMRNRGFAFVVQDIPTIEVLAATKRHVKVHIEVNTGMNRRGVGSAQLGELVDCIARSPQLELDGLMSHLADSDGDDPATVRAAVARFDAAVELVRARGLRPKWLHVSQTAGSVVARSKYANALRLGIGLYGLNPFNQGHPAHKRLSGLKPALRLVSTITNVIDLKQGDKVSYNYTYTAPKDMRIGVLPLGYYEGVSRDLSNRGQVKSGKNFLPIVGRVCMNHTIVSLAGTGLGVNDEITVYSNHQGDRNSIARLARDYGLFSYSLLTGLSADVRRVLVD